MNCFCRFIFHRNKSTDLNYDFYGIILSNFAFITLTYIHKTLHMANLLESIKSYISPALISQAADMLGENENHISKSLGSLVPVILSGILNKTNDAGAMESIFRLLVDDKNSNFLSDPAALISSGNLAQGDPKDLSGELLGKLFGPKVPAIINAISSFAGTKSGTTSSLLGVAGPLVMGVLGNKINADGLNVKGLVNLLHQEKSSILGALPGGLSSIMGLASNLGKPEHHDDPAPSSGNRWMLPLFLLLALGGGIVYYMKSCANKATTPVEVATPVKVDTVKVEVPTGFTKKLGSGFELKGNKDGIESQLVTFIEDASKVVDKTTWFNFDRLLFETASAKINMEKSADQLTNMVEVLKAFPKVKLRIGGYTDNTGNEVANMKLSQARAEAVVSYLVEKGVDKSRLTAEGYGSQHPVGDNATEDGRAQNRRIAVRVTEK